MKENIIALGGGGFSEEGPGAQLDNYILSQARKSNPTVCFIPTASGDSQSYIERFYGAFQNQHCTPLHISLFNPPKRDIRETILNCDVIYVGGGSTKNLLVLWKEWGLDIYLKEALKNGIVLAGISAGAICWFEQGLTDSTGELTKINALGFLPGSCSPHFDSEIDRRPKMKNMIQTGVLDSGYGIDDYVALHFEERKLKNAVRSNKSGKAYYFSLHLDRFEEKQVIPVDL
jgi:peptidase E